MLYFVFFLFELGLLFFLSKKLVGSLAQILYKFTKSHRFVVHTLALIFLPGTMIHELAHLLFSGIMLVPVGELSVIPVIEEKGVRLGSVQIGKTDPFRRTLIGVAPVFLGMILIFSILFMVKIGVSPWWQILLALYFIFQIGNTMFSSRKDIEGSILFAVLTIVLCMTVLVSIYFLRPLLLQDIWLNIAKMDLGFMISFFKQASSYLIVPVGLDLLIILLTIPLKRR